MRFRPGRGKVGGVKLGHRSGVSPPGIANPSRRATEWPNTSVPPDLRDGVCLLMMSARWSRACAFTPRPRSRSWHLGRRSPSPRAWPGCARIFRVPRDPRGAAGGASRLLPPLLTTSRRPAAVGRARPACRDETGPAPKSVRRKLLRLARRARRCPSGLGVGLACEASLLSVLPSAIACTAVEPPAREARAASATLSRRRRAVRLGSTAILRASEAQYGYDGELEWASTASTSQQSDVRRARRRHAPDIARTCFAAVRRARRWTSAAPAFRSAKCMWRPTRVGPTKRRRMLRADGHGSTTRTLSTGFEPRPVRGRRGPAGAAGEPFCRRRARTHSD